MPDPCTDIYNYRRVSDELATSGQPREGQLADIAAGGFEVIINLALHDDPRYSLPDEAGSVRALGLDYIHIPVDFDSPSGNDLSKFFAAMDSNRGRRIWIHCAANKRVTAFLGLYRVLQEGWETARAFELMDSVWQPNDTWSAFITARLNRT